MSDKNRGQEEPEELPAEVGKLLAALWKEAPLYIRIAGIMAALAVVAIICSNVCEFFKTGRMPS